MASANTNFKSRDDHRKQMELEEARKAGLAPAELDEDGKEINPHIPQYMSSAPWYLNQGGPSLKHQRKWKEDPNFTKDWYDRGAKTFQATSFRKGACTNCGAMTHASKLCMERPRKVGAKFTQKHIAPDEKIEQFELDYEGKRDRWNGYDPTTYSHVMDTFEKKDELRAKLNREKALRKKLEGKDGEPQLLENGEKAKKDDSDSESEDEDLEDEAKISESKQGDFAKVEKRVRTTGGGSTGTVRNLRIREDTAKYLINLDLNSAHYDPKTRSMREDPNPEVDPNEKFYFGDNAWRGKGPEAEEFKRLNVHAWEAYDRGQDIHLQGAPSQAELLHKEFLVKKEKLKGATKESVVAKYGNAAAGEQLPEELLLGQTEKQVEYDRAGRPLLGQEKVVPRSRYEEDVLINNHTSVWGSWWHEGQWGYKCCHSTTRNSYCTGQAGIEASEESAALLKTNLDRKEEVEAEKAKAPAKKEEKAMATWGEDTPDDVKLDKNKLKEALMKEDYQSRQATDKDERKRKYNVTYENGVTPEEMEAYRMKKTRADDPMAAFLGKDEIIEAK